MRFDGRYSQMFNTTHFWVLKKLNALFATLVGSGTRWNKNNIKIHLVKHWDENRPNRCHSCEIDSLSLVYGTVYSTHAAIIISASLEGLLSSTSRLIILSDLMSRLHPRKKMPKMTVSDSTQRTAICTKRTMNWSRSSWTGEPNPSLVINEKLQHPRTPSKGCLAVEIVRFSSPCETFMSSFLWRFVTRIDVLKLPMGLELAKVTCAFPWIS